MHKHNLTHIFSRIVTAFVLGGVAAIILITLLVLSSDSLRQDIVENLITTYIDQNPAFHKKIAESHRNKKLTLKSDATRLDTQSGSFDRVSLENLNRLRDISTAPAVGPQNPQITIIEFFDYACPFCKIASGSYREIIKNEKNKILWIFRDYPILGPNSLLAAKAALASAKQGKYIDFHYELFAIRGPLSQEAIFEAAKKVGLNIEMLKKDMNSVDIDNQLTTNRELAKKIGVRGTPTLIVNSILVHGLVKNEALYKIIEDEQK